MRNFVPFARGTFADPAAPPLEFTRPRWTWGRSLGINVRSGDPMWSPFPSPSHGRKGAHTRDCLYKPNPFSVRSVSSAVNLSSRWTWGRTLRFAPAPPSSGAHQREVAAVGVAVGHRPSLRPHGSAEV